MIKTDGKRTLVVLGASKINLSCVQFNGISYTSGLRLEDMTSENVVDIHLHTPEVIDAIIGKLNEVKQSISQAIENHKKEESSKKRKGKKQKEE